MKKNTPIILVTVLLALVAGYFIISNKKTTIKEELKDFAVSDTAAITKIFIADKGGRTGTLQRQPDGKWKINNKFHADQDKINTLLGTIKTLRVRTRVGNMEFNGVVNSMAASAVKCEIYTSDPDKPFKVYYVGGETKDLLGTYMLLENSSTPFVMEIPGFNGYLSTRYFTSEVEWRDHIVFDYRPDEISSFTFMNAPEPAKSFKIEVNGRKYKVSSPVTGQVIAAVDTIAVESYLGFFSFINFEGFDNEFSQHQRDSLFALGAVYTMSVKDRSGKENSISIYPKPITKRSLSQSDPQGNPLKYDVDKMYALVNNGQDFVVIQQYVFGKFFRTLSDFDATVKKAKK